MMREQIRQQIEILKRVSAGIPRDPIAQAAVDHVIANLQAAIAPQWVPVAERLPEDMRDVYVWSAEFGINTAWLSIANKRWMIGDDAAGDMNITHWHEIEYPEPPKVAP